VNFGLTSEDIIEMMMLAGKNKKIVTLTISDYNPTIEDYRTGRLLTNMVYYFILGYSSR
jgi:formiminoglutamase